MLPEAQWEIRWSRVACVLESVASWRAVLAGDAKERTCGLRLVRRSSQWMQLVQNWCVREGAWETNGRQVTGSCRSGLEAVKRPAFAVLWTCADGRDFWWASVRGLGRSR